jgi:hypothetical protein
MDTNRSYMLSVLAVTILLCAVFSGVPSRCWLWWVLSSASRDGWTRPPLVAPCCRRHPAFDLLGLRAWCRPHPLGPPSVGRAFSPLPDARPRGASLPELSRALRDGWTRLLL